MKKYICILASAALLAACEQKTETTTTEPVASPTATAAPEMTMSPAATTESPAASATTSPAP